MLSTSSFRPRLVSTSAVNNNITPHSGYHWDGTPRRFFEGWYFKVMMPKEKESFALIYSVEDPSGRSPMSGIGAQVMGPQDGYIIQYDLDVSKFWAGKESLTLGTCFQMKSGKPLARRLISKEAFDSTVLTGFQSTLNFHQGKIIQNEAGSTGELYGIGITPWCGELGHIDPSVEQCAWCFKVQGITGWGDVNRAQKSTAGWLAALPVFEPHWQVMMSQGLATGWMQWGDQKFQFEDAPTYYEKNWGAGFPSKWFWIQCNTFQEVKDLSVTVVGARRKLPGPQTIEETVGMIGIHYMGKFYEFVPWEGQVSWRVDPWGYWSIFATGDGYEAEVVATCNSKGTILRAPKDDEGLTPFCRDSFFANTTLKLWKVSSRKRELIAEGVSDTGVVEVGGGPWWNQWKDEANMREPFRSLVKLPIDTKELSKFVPPPLRPPGL